MRAHYGLLALVPIVTAAPVIGCDDESDPSWSSSGTTHTGGTTTTSGSAGTGGTTTSGTGGEGGGGSPPDFWQGQTYDADALPFPEHGEHSAGELCMDCHDADAEVFLLAGTVYQSDGTTGAPHVQVGLQLDGTLYTAYSAHNGNFWVADPGGSPNWEGAKVRLRNGNGDTEMSSSPTAECNGCHTAATVLKEP